MPDGTLTSFMAARAEDIVSACTSCGGLRRGLSRRAPCGDFRRRPESRCGRGSGGASGRRQAGRPGGGLGASVQRFAGSAFPPVPKESTPRTMVMLASARSAEAHSDTPQLFRKMARAIRLMAAMQLAPADLARLLQPPKPRAVPVVFYVGCNAVRTPHLLFNAMYVLDAVGVDYEVLGGPAACCGIIHTKWEGEADAGGRVTDGTLKRFGEFEPERVLSWCPSCQLHLGKRLPDTGSGLRVRACDPLPGREKRAAGGPLHDGSADAGAPPRP